MLAGARPATPAAPALNLVAPVPGADRLTLAVAIAFALLGGLVLNLMPCVFPVLSIKVLGFATYADYSLDDAMAKKPGAAMEVRS